MSGAAGGPGERWDADGWLLERELFGIRPGLARMRALLELLGRPQERFAAIHVVGSNGKTSTVTMAAALLQRRGVRSGAYASPHLVRFAERVQIAGAPLDAGPFAAAVARVRAAAEELEAQRTTASDGQDVGDGGADGGWDGGERVTQFEAITATAYLAFAEAGVECAVIEAGLGGRWDATNVLPRDPAGPGRPPVAVLTSVSLEHTRWLGTTNAAIAAEKVEVLRPGGTLVLGHGLPAEAVAVAEALAAERGATIVRAPADPGSDVPTPGTGPDRGGALFQRRNLATAMAAVDAQLGAPDPAAARALAAGIVVPGRFQTVDPGGSGGPTVIHDGAHNEAGMVALADALDAAPPARPLVALIGVLDDKDPAAMVRALDRWCDRVVAVAPGNPRALPAADLAAIVARALPGRPVDVAAGPHEGLRMARTLAGASGTVLATGSLHLLADLHRGPAAGPASAF
ncbi:Dihydrofolate synthase [Patulibacter medicamentivorans]|uniref:tetrahydrofolate synthase n=1 Tax=Patulibacter medicamentivorans TaxID=1097667 RepID=H0E8J4_9ACTN|nr:cyanophycin synthetase [Patulibacter medicamentivorans]EHN09994.1 Dihydrofolate synthase [Patulibacter medicamentivorans]